MLRHDQFITARRPRWERLEGILIEISKRGLENVPAADLQDLGLLYRHTTSDLAIARRDFPGDLVTTYLNQLVARAHPVIYRGRPGGVAQVGYFVRYGFPEAFRHAGRYTLAAFVIAMVAAVAAALLVVYRLSFANVLLGTGTTRYLESNLTHHHLWVKSATEQHSVAASFIMTNNIQVAILAFAGGLLVGTFTVIIMVTNGINLGAVLALAAHYHLGLALLTFMLPHGVIELTVIFASAGAGMMIGDAILRPGIRRRSDALVDAAMTAGKILLGCAALLVIAGTIEAFFSPSDAPDLLKIAVAGVLFVLLYAYLLGSRPRVVRPRYGFEEVLGPTTATAP